MHEAELYHIRMHTHTCMYTRVNCDFFKLSRLYIPNNHNQPTTILRTKHHATTHPSVRHPLPYCGTTPRAQPAEPSPGIDTPKSLQHAQRTSLYLVFGLCGISFECRDRQGNSYIHGARGCSYQPTEEPHVNTLPTRCIWHSHTGMLDYKLRYIYVRYLDKMLVIY